MANQLCFLAMAAICFTLLLIFSGANAAKEEDDKRLATNAANPAQNALLTQSDKQQQAHFSGSNSALKLVKRAPIGFTGMRGKKDDYDELNANRLDWHNLMQHLALDQNPNDDELMNWQRSSANYGERFKKAPTAFYGLPGKKFSQHGSSGGAAYFERLNNILQQLEEQRLRDILLEDYYERLLARDDDIGNSLRDDLEKRAPTGFTGLRGKRSISSSNDFVNDYDNDNDKRAPSTGFVGLRGKKDMDFMSTLKRTPFSDSQSSDDARKKQRYVIDFGNKFVAVRGKKDSLYDDEEDLADDAQNDNALDAADSLDARSEYAGNMPTTSLRRPAQQRFFMSWLPSLLGYGSSNGKRTPSGFVGMRGKRADSTQNVGAA